MRLQSKSQVFITLFLIALPIAIFYWLKQSGNFDIFFVWTQQNLYLYLVVLFLLKTAAIVYPPLPGGILTLGSIPVIGWLNAYLVDLAGSTTGSVIDYYLGRKYGLAFLGKFLDPTILDKIKALKIKKHKEFEAIFVLRFLGGGVVEFVSYACGILKVKYSTFFVVSVASHMVLGVPTYYLAESIFTTRNIVVSVLLASFFVFLLYKFKGRYFE